MSDEMPKWGTPEWHRLHPTYFTKEEMQRTMPELLQTLRSELTRVRGKLGDLKRVGWSDRLEPAEGGLTLVIQSLYLAIEEIERAQRGGR